MRIHNPYGIRYSETNPLIVRTVDFLAEISMSVYDAFKTASNCLTNIKEIYTDAREEIRRAQESELTKIN